MYKFPILFFLLIISITFAQTQNTVYLLGSNNDVSMNASFSPDGSKLAFTKASYKGIWIYDISTTSVVQITDEQSAGFGYTWSADSKSILARVAKYEDSKRLNAVKIFNIDTKVSNQLTEYKTSMPYLPEWSNQDTKVILPSKQGTEIFNSGKLNKSLNTSEGKDIINMYDKIVIRDPNSSVEKYIQPFPDKQILSLVVSPNGEKVAFEIMGGDMYSMNIDGTGLIDLGRGNCPRWSPDSKEIVYMITQDNGYDFTGSDIFIINSDSSQKKNLTNTSDKIEMNPCFSPDGKTIVFDVYNEGSIYLMNIE
jgi:Tol biopolymer transport system component